MQTRMNKRDHNFPILHLKYLSSHSVLASYCPNRALQSQTAGLLVVLKIHKSRLGGRAFSYQTSQTTPVEPSPSLDFGHKDRYPLYFLRLDSKLSI